MSWNTRKCNICREFTRSVSQKTAYCTACKPKMPEDIAKLLLNSTSVRRTKRGR
ncbi:hypothetical protein GQ473_07365 [archaeon]|nr:hypothetical protein [archaeon]